jgi:hypothetical protein
LKHPLTLLNITRGSTLLKSTSQTSDPLLASFELLRLYLTRHVGRLWVAGNHACHQIDVRFVRSSSHSVYLRYLAIVQPIGILCCFISH